MLRSLPGLLEPEEINEKVLPELQKAAASESADVRRALAGSLPHLSTHFQKFAEPAAAVKALIWQLFKDESPEVRVSLFVNLEPFLRTQTLQATLTNFLGVLQELLNDKTWKVRLDAVKVIELLLTKFSDEVANDERLIKALGEKLSDKVAAVRRAAVTSIRTICAALGLAWSERHGVGLFHGFATSLNYLYRLNFPLGIAEICKCLSAQTLAKEVELLIKLGKDPVANVRANTLIALVRVSQRCEDKGLADRTRKMAEELSADLDGETQRLAQKISTTKDWKGLAEQFSTQMA